MSVLRGDARKLTLACDEVRTETLDYADGFAAQEALDDFPPLIRRERDPLRRIGLRSRLADCAYMVLDYDTAIHECRVALRAVARVTAVPTPPEASLRATLGTCYSRLGHTTEAVAELQRAAEIFALTGDRESESEALAELGEALTDLGDDEQALPILTTCLKRLSGPWARDAAEQVARIARRRGDHDAEIAALEVARREGTGPGSEVYDHEVALGSTTLELVEALVKRRSTGDLARAISVLEDSLERLEKHESDTSEDADALRSQLGRLRPGPTTGR